MSHRAAYLAAAIRLYLDLPGAPPRASRADWAVAATLYDRGVPLDTLAHACASPPSGATSDPPTSPSSPSTPSPTTDASSTTSPPTTSTPDTSTTSPTSISSSSRQTSPHPSAHPATTPLLTAKIPRFLTAANSPHDLDPLAYLRDLFERLPTHPRNAVAQLTPAAWAQDLRATTRAAA